MGADENRYLIRRMIEEVWNQADANAIERFVAPHLREEIMKHHAELMDAFSDVHVEIEEIIAEDDMIAVRLMVSGRHDRGPFADQPPSGERLQWGSFRFFRIAGDKVEQTWAMQDRLGLMEQLGAVRVEGSDVHWADGATG